MSASVQISSCLNSRRFCVAPMLDWTDRHERYFLRLMTRYTYLYTEMITTSALIKGDRDRHLRFSPQEQPVALQLGGSDPQDLAECAKMAEGYGYDEVNINVGCPSDRVQKGAFGACLMAEPGLIAECVDAMRSVVSIPVTVKNRIGIDDQDEEQSLRHFIDVVSQAGCDTFIVHARKAWLKGLSPKENRDVPPLNYDLVYRVKQEFPELEVIINGGIKTLDSCLEHLQYVDGVMLGREAYHNPYLLMQVDGAIYSNVADEMLSRKQVLQQYFPYIEDQIKQGSHLKHMSRHLLGLFQGQVGAKAWRRHISENAHKEGAGVELLQEAMEMVVD
ncbi:MAG TPA: tRNA dihydrouridine(20/20a) synthase DusA [Leucothrix mucor]|nr:tRNA dihydrouridine(20/20a) synthase DusA [Leucothrix mucor]